MDQKTFKKINKPAACTLPVWANLVEGADKYNVLNKIREESVIHHGQSLDECPKRKICFTKNCLGRPLPVDAPTFKPLLDELKKTHKVVGNELFIDNCGTCAIKTSCTSICHQTNDWMQRESDPQPNLIYQANLENYDTGMQLSNTSSKPKTLDLNLCWEVISEKKANIIKKYLYEAKDFEVVAQELGINNKSFAKYEYYSTLNKLAEFSVMRNFLKENQDKLTETQQNVLNLVYYGNKSLTVVAKELNISTESVRRTILRVVESNDLKWPTFVKKEGSKLIYDIPEVLR